MTPDRFRLLMTGLLASAALVPMTPALAANCPAGTGDAITLGTATRVEGGAAHLYTVELGKGDGVLIDLGSYDDPAKSGEAATGAAVTAPAVITASDFADAGEGGKLQVCNASGALLAPRPWDVFEGGGALGTNGDGGQRLRFVAPDAGRYTIAVPSADEARELLVRGRKLDDTGSEVIAAELDSKTITGKVGEGVKPIYSFTGTAGQWVELKATSESDTLLRLVGQDRSGNYTEIAMNDDSDGLNPMIRRKLPVAGTYYLRVESLGASEDKFDLSLKRISAPKPPPPPTPLSVGREVNDKLANEDDNRIYSLPVVAGHSYTLTLDAPYDGYLAIGLANPLEPDDGDLSPQASFSEVRNQDSGLEGKEEMTFTVRNSGTMQVLVRSFGIGETDGSYTLKAEDTGQ